MTIQVSKTGTQSATGRGILALKKFGREAGLSSVTLWRWRKAGWINTVNIAGRPYLTADGLAEFNRRAGAGEFASERKMPTGKTATA